ncbi:MAG: hypothetical protein MSC45_03980 [Mobiluncus sp.]|nr:hypothetical protein [Mobiluncus sp.]
MKYSHATATDINLVGVNLPHFSGMLLFASRNRLLITHLRIDSVPRSKGGI